MGTSFPDGGKRLKNAEFFTGIQCPLLQILLINVAIIFDNGLSEDLVLLRLVWDSFNSAHPSIQVSDVLSLHNGLEKVYLFQCPNSLPHLSTKTRKKTICIDISPENTVVEF